MSIQPESLAQIRARLAAIVESSDDAIVSKDLNGVILTWNQGAERIFGYPAYEAIGRHISIIIPDHLISDEAKILAKIRAGERVRHFDTTRRRKDGAFVDISLTVSPIMDENGEVIGASKIARDITEQKRARRALSEMNQLLEERVRARTEDLERSLREIDSFNHAVAHDLRTPLRSILGFSRILNESPRLDAEEREHLTFIQEASEQMNRIIQGLLALSKIRRERVHRSRLDLSEMAAKVVDRMRSTDPTRVVRADIEPGLSADADRGMMESLLANLIGNAWKFTKPRAEAVIRVGATHREGRRFFFVQDNGVGFAPEQGARILRAFQRLRPNEFEGSGIGLTTVHRIVEAHGGRIIAEGVPDGGATILFSLDPTSPLVAGVDKALISGGTEG